MPGESWGERCRGPATSGSARDRDCRRHPTTFSRPSGGARVEDERGTSLFGGQLTQTTRANYSAFAEARASSIGRLFVTDGGGFDHNEIVGNAASPRVSAAAYLRQPPATAEFGDTKLTFNAGKGIKEPNLSQELSSLFVLIPAATASSPGVTPVGPERSRTLDIGLEQGLARGRGRCASRTSTTPSTT